MDAIFIDTNGNKKNFLYQYDVGQRIRIENFQYSKTPKVQYQIRSIDVALSVPSTLNGTTLDVSIPNKLLEYGEEITAYFYIEDDDLGMVVEAVFISVQPRKRPSNYNYTSETFAKTINGMTISSNDGVASVFQWKENEIIPEDTIGLFVNAVSSSEISISTSYNDVYGVVVDSTGLLSGCQESMLDKDGKLLPQYVMVRSCGFASVIDDGTCEVGEMCIPNGNGIATKSSNAIGFDVIERIDDNHVFIFVDASMSAINSINANLSSHKNNKSNPHKVTATQVGLGNVDNTSDEDKPISKATQNALDAKADLEEGILKLSQLPSHSHTKSEVGLGNVDNTSDKNKPISTAVQAALDTKATLIDGKISKEMLPDGIGAGSDNIVVETIADRDTLEPFEGLLVHVKDASGDETVSSVYADYIYDGEVWVKTGGYISSGEGGSTVESVAWENITNKPSSFTPKTHASTHLPNGTDPISLSDLGAVSQIDFDELKSQVEELSGFVNGLENADTKSY